MIAFQLMISWLAMTTPRVETTLREKIWWPQSKENVRLNKESSFRPAVVGGDTNHGDSVVGVLTDHSIKSAVFAICHWQLARNDELSVFYS